MKKEPLKIYIDRLKDDDTEQIFEILDPESFDLTEEELSFEGKITVSGQVYLAKNHLVLDGKIKATAIMPCCICNQKTEVALHIDDFTHTIEICEVPSAVYDFSEEVRSALLLKIPHFVECNEGNCPQRKEVSKYFKKGDTHSPFSGLFLKGFDSSFSN